MAKRCFCPKTNSFLTVPHVTRPHQTPLPRLRSTSPPTATRGPRRPTRAKTRIGCRASVTPPPCGHDACSPAKCPEHRGVRVRHHALRRSVAEYGHELLHAVNAGRHGDLLGCSERFTSGTSPAPAPVQKRSMLNGLLSSPITV